MLRKRAQIKSRPVPGRLNAIAVQYGILALLIGLAAPFYVKAGGDISLGELAFPLLLPIVLVMRRKEIGKSSIATILFLLGLWLVGQLLTDLYRRTEFMDWVRGDADIVVFGVGILVLIGLLGKSETRKVIFAVGVGVGTMLAARFEPTQPQTDDPWKFGYSPGVTLLLFVVCCHFFRRRNYFAILLLVLGVSVVNVVENFRSMVLFLLITVALTVPLIPERIGRLRLLPPPGSTARLMVMACLALGAGGLAFGMIKLATMSGMMGQESQEKNQQQSQAVGGMFVGGRPEILVSSRAVFDSPILGHGSWARDSKYIEMLRDIKSRYGIAYDPAAGEEEAADVIPTHSYLFGAWVWAGILGAVFWLYVLSKVIKSIVKLSLLRPSTMPLYAYLLVRQFWNILFSPFGSTERILTAFVIVIMIELLEVKLPETVIQRIQTVRSTITRPRLWRPSFR
jgi:hypothetical protein